MASTFLNYMMCTQHVNISLQNYDTKCAWCMCIFLANFIIPFKIAITGKTPGWIQFHNILYPLIYRLFYTRKQWRDHDGTHDGKKFDTYATDHTKISTYYFEHYKNGEMWMLRMDNRPEVIYPIWPLLANLWKPKKGVIHYTNRRIDVTLYSVFGGIGLIG